MISNFKTIVYEKDESIAYVTLNRPEVMNALHPPAHEELWEVWYDFRDDPDVWVAILTGAGERAFSAGNDLKYQAAHAGEPTPVLLPGGFGGITNRFDCNKPIIAAVNGYALGGGFEIALACDIIIAAEQARFGLPEPTVGLAPGAGGVHRLPRQVGQPAAEQAVGASEVDVFENTWGGWRQVSGIGHTCQSLLVHDDRFPRLHLTQVLGTQVVQSATLRSNDPSPI